MLETIIQEVNAVAWGLPMLILLLGTGIYLTLGLGLMTLRKVPRAVSLLFSGVSGRGDGDIVPFKALMTSLSATIGTGNIAGVATAITLGGPGALFWMWITALFGMATKYAEGVLAVRYREQDDQGGYSGGPMYYIRNGLSARHGAFATGLAFAFALFGATAGFGLANTVQSNSVAQVLTDNAGVPWWITGLVLMLMVGAVILGGIKRIADTAGAVVPAMAISYIIMSLIVILMNISDVPAAFSTIVDSAFNGASAAGGFAGATVWAAIRFGVARGIFSNEAGLGSAPIAHAAAKTNEPVEQGLVAMLGTMIDTLIVCTMTGLVIVLTGVLESGVSGASLTSMAFGAVLPGGEWGGHHWCRRFRDHNHDGLGLLWRAVCGLSLWHEGHHAVSGVVGACDPCRRRRGPGLNLVGRRYTQRLHGHPESDRPSIVVACCICTNARVFRA